MILWELIAPVVFDRYEVAQEEFELRRLISALVRIQQKFEHLYFKVLHSCQCTKSDDSLPYRFPIIIFLLQRGE